jgi:hypothetical protein
MGSATRQTISEVKDRLAALDSERERVAQLLELLIEEFGNGAAPRKAKKRRSSTQEDLSYATAKEQIHIWLKKHQGSSRGEVIKGTELPAGTVGSYLSTQKKMFENRERKWYAI